MRRWANSSLVLGLVGGTLLGGFVVEVHSFYTRTESALTWIEEQKGLIAQQRARIEAAQALQQQQAQQQQNQSPAK